MRIKGLIGIAILGIIIGALLYFTRNSFVEGALENAASSMAGAKVEIDDLSFSISQLSIQMNRLQVADKNDPWKNLFETGRLAFDMEALPLLNKKVLINEISIVDVRLGGKRATDGTIEQPEPVEPEPEEPGWLGEATQGLQDRVAEAPVLNLAPLKKKINVDSLISEFDIQSIGKIDAARKDAAATFDKWDKAIAEFKPQNDITQLAADIDELKSKKLSSIEDYLSTADKARKIIKTLNRLKKDVAEKKKAANTDFKRLSTAFVGVDNWFQNDFNAIKSKANIGEFNAQNIGKMLFGDMVISPVIKLLDYVNTIRNYMPIAQQFMSAGKVEKPKRLQGQDITFPIRNRQPRFLLENIKLSGASNSLKSEDVLSISGTIGGVTSEPKIYGNPLIFDLDVDVPGSSIYKVTGKFDHTSKTAKEQMHISASGVRFGKIALPDKKYLPNMINANSGSIDAKVAIVGKQMNIKINFSAKPVSFAFAQNSGEDLITRVTRDVFASIDQLTFTAGISGASDDMKLNVQSNIDKILAKRIKNVLGEAGKAARAEMERKLRKLIEPKKKEALAYVDKNKKRLEGEIEKIQNQVNDYIAVVEQKKKELEEQAKKKKKEGVNKAKGKLKDLFKKK